MRRYDECPLLAVGKRLPLVREILCLISLDCQINSIGFHLRNVTSLWGALVIRQCQIQCKHSRHVSTRCLFLFANYTGLSTPREEYAQYKSIKLPIVLPIMTSHCLEVKSICLQGHGNPCFISKCQILKLRNTLQTLNTSCFWCNIACPNGLQASLKLLIAAWDY